MRNRVIVLGSTGSIGRSSLEVLARLGDPWEVAALAACSRAESLAEQANRFRPAAIALTQSERVGELERALSYHPRIYIGQDALTELLCDVACDCVVCAVVGATGLLATLQAVEMGRRVALANKEALVIAGSLIMPLAKRSGACIIPIDSEHSAVWQALHAGRREEVRRVYLTASGGPFRGCSEEAMADVSVADALRHPTWNMGPKITIDSATMMNKALEIVEAKWLFDLASDQIEVVVHPESIIHSLVEFCDGSLVAQLGTPDMRTPIQYALTYPSRMPCPSEPLDLFAVGRLNLSKPDELRFPALRLGYEVARRGGTCGAVLSAAGEVAVDLFLNEKIRFQDMARLAEQALAKHACIENPALEDLLAADRWARDEVKRCLMGARQPR